MNPEAKKEWVSAIRACPVLVFFSVNVCAVQLFAPFKGDLLCQLMLEEKLDKEAPNFTTLKPLADWIEENL